MSSEETTNNRDDIDAEPPADSQELAMASGALSPVKTTEKSVDEAVSPTDHPMCEKSPSSFANNTNGNPDVDEDDQSDKEVAKPKADITAKESPEDSPMHEESAEISNSIQPQADGADASSAEGKTEETPVGDSPEAIKDSEEDHMDDDAVAATNADNTLAAKETDGNEPGTDTPVEASPKKSKKKASPQKKKASPPTPKTTPQKESPSSSRHRSPVKASDGPTAAGKTDLVEDAAKTDATDKLPLLQAPLVVEGKRDRKSTDRLTMTVTSSAKKTGTDLPEGSGTKFGEIAYVDAMILKTKADDLKPLHRLLFGRTGSLHEIKKNIRSFCGFNDEAQLEKKKNQLSSKSWVMKDLKSVCLWCGLERGGTKEDLISRILEFIAKPTDAGLKPPQSKKSTTTKRKRTAKPKTKSAASSSKKTSDKKEKDEEEEKSDKSDDDDSEDDEDAKDDEIEETKEATPPPSKKAKHSAKSKEKTAATPKQKSAPETKPKAVTNDDLTAAIKVLLKGVNLEEVTMKEMCKKVYDRFPNENLTAKKDYIKSTVKKLISEST